MAFVTSVPVTIPNKSVPTCSLEYSSFTSSSPAVHSNCRCAKLIAPIRLRRTQNHRSTPTATIEAPTDSSNRDNEDGDQSPASTSASTPDDDGDVSFPTLYDAWFAPEHELSTQMQQAVSRAYDAGLRDMELQWPVVPNLEEIAAGTLLNFEFGKQVARDFGMTADRDYQLIKRYLASFGNVWWASRLAQSDALRGKTIYAVSTDAISKARAEPVLSALNVRLVSIRDIGNIEFGDDDVVVVMDPRFDEVWKKAMTAKVKSGKTNVCMIFLNSQFNESYGLTGPRKGKLLKDITPVYFLKRVTRGFVFYSYPGEWKACMENPDTSIEVVKVYDKEPKLRDIANVVRNESNSRYGGLNNDRYVRGFGGRL